MRQQERLTGIPDDVAWACLREYNRYLVSSEVRELARPEGRKRKFDNRDGFIKPKARSMEQNTSSLSISQNHPGWKRRKGQRVTGKNPVPQSGLKLACGKRAAALQNAQRKARPLQEARKGTA